MKNVIKMKKTGYLGLTNTWGQKSLEKFEEENDKQAWIGLIEKEKGEKDRKVFEKVMNTCWEKDFNILFFRILIGWVPIG